MLAAWRDFCMDVSRGYLDGCFCVVYYRLHLAPWRLDCIYGCASHGGIPINCQHKEIFSKSACNIDDLYSPKLKYGERADIHFSPPGAGDCWYV